MNYEHFVTAITNLCIIWNPTLRQEHRPLRAGSVFEALPSSPHVASHQCRWCVPPLRHRYVGASPVLWAGRVVDVQLVGPRFWARMASGLGSVARTMMHEMSCVRRLAARQRRHQRTLMSDAAHAGASPTPNLAPHHSGVSGKALLASSAACHRSRLGEGAARPGAFPSWCADPQGPQGGYRGLGPQLRCPQRLGSFPHRDDRSACFPTDTSGSDDASVVQPPKFARAA